MLALYNCPVIHLTTCCVSRLWVGGFLFFFYSSFSFSFKNVHLGSLHQHGSGSVMLTFLPYFIFLYCLNGGVCEASRLRVQLRGKHGSPWGKGSLHKHSEL